MYDYAAKIRVFPLNNKKKMTFYVFYFANFALNSFNRLAAC
jgi:hypothetical protein